MRTTSATRPVAALLLLLLSLLGTPALAQGPAAGPPGDRGQSAGAPGDRGQAPGDEADGPEVFVEDTDTGADEGETDDGHGRSAAEAGDLAGHLSPSVADVDQQVVIHATYQLTDRPGNRPDREEEDDSEDDAEDEEDAEDEDDTRALVFAEDGDTDLADGGDDGDGDDEDGDDEGGDDSRKVKCQPSVVFDETTDTIVFVESLDTAPGARPACDVTFVVDHGDDSDPEIMSNTKTRGGDGSRKALAKHSYAADGAYAVTITAYPLDGEPTTLELTAQVGGGTARLEGDSRIETAVRTSQEDFADDGSADAVVLARADAFADALSASTLAVLTGAPILLTTSDALPTIVADEIARVLDEGGTVFLLGGEAAIGAGVADEITALGYAPVRLSDTDRIGTTLAVAEYLLATGLVPTEIVLASAADYPDALAGAALAAEDDALLLLTDPDSLDPRVADLLAGLSPAPSVLIVGGEAAVSTAVEQALIDLGLTVDRAAGADRFATATAVAEVGDDGGDTVVLATGRNYPDALAGAALAGRSGAPVLLVGDQLPASVVAFLTERADRIDTIITLGGRAAVSDAVIGAAADLTGARVEAR